MQVFFACIKMPTLTYNMADSVEFLCILQIIFEKNILSRFSPELENIISFKSRNEEQIVLNTA